MAHTEDAYIDLVTDICMELCQQNGLTDSNEIIEVGFQIFDQTMRQTRSLVLARQAALKAMQDFDNHERRN